MNRMSPFEVVTTFYATMDESYRRGILILYPAGWQNFWMQPEINVYKVQCSPEAGRVSLLRPACVLHLILLDSF